MKAKLAKPNQPILISNPSGSQKEPISWDQSGLPIRKAVVELCGWCNSEGEATPTGLRIAKTNWNDLTPAAMRVLKNHGIMKDIIFIR